MEGTSQQSNIKEILSSEKFDAIKFVNKLFPAEDSLTNLEEVIQGIRRQITKVDNEILTGIRAQSTSDQKAREDLASAQAQIGSLGSRIESIGAKAQATEECVQTICRDIRKLDHAKLHLTHTITSLRRLSMLTSAVSQLENQMSDRGRYQECANLLEAVAELTHHFEQYSHVAQVAEIRGKLSIIGRTLEASVYDEFKNVWKKHDPTPVDTSEDMRDTVHKSYEPKWQTLHQACLVVQALGPEVQQKLMQSMIDQEVALFKSMMPFDLQQYKTLASLTKRFNWLGSRLSNRFLSCQRNVFPQSWAYGPKVAYTFCQLFAEQLSEILKDNMAAGKLEVKTMLEAVFATRKFEQQLIKLFQKDDYTRSYALMYAQASFLDDKSKASASKMRLAATLRAARMGDDGVGSESETQTDGGTPHSIGTATDPGGAGEIAGIQFEGCISKAFEPYLGLYVQLQERELSDHVSTVLKQEEASLDDSNAQSGVGGGGSEEVCEEFKVLQSANKIMAHLKLVAERCHQFVSNGQVLLDLSGVFQKTLQQYCTSLRNQLPQPSSGADVSSNFRLPLQGVDWHVKAKDEQIILICKIVSTADFCSGRVGQFEVWVAKKLAKGLGHKVDFTEEQNQFTQLMTSALLSLLLAICTRLDQGLADMMRVLWSAIEGVGDMSSYASYIQSTLTWCSTTVAPMLSLTDWEYLCDKIVRVFIPRYYDAVLRCRRVSDMGFQQMLLDAESIKKSLRDLPANAPGQLVKTQSVSYQAYRRYVQQEVGQAESLMKIAASRPDHLLETFKTLLPDKSNSLQDFQRLLEMKALRKAEQQALLVEFQKSVGISPAAIHASLANYASHSAGLTQDKEAFDQSNTAGGGEGVQRISQLAAGGGELFSTLGKKVLQDTAQKTRNSMAIMQEKRAVLGNLFKTK